MQHEVERFVYAKAEIAHARSVFERYNIVSRSDLREAARKLEVLPDGHDFGQMQLKQASLGSSQLPK